MGHQQSLGINITWDRSTILVELSCHSHFTNVFTGTVIAYLDLLFYSVFVMN